MKKLFGEEKQNRIQSILSQAVIVQQNGFRKSSSDKKIYRPIKLENDLEALLISDPNTEKAAASLAVNVGSFSDPVELPGLAHFLEHMMSKGTKMYPGENDYKKFLSENGGRSNASTSPEITDYHFEVMANKLPDALDRFSQAFIEPLIAETTVQREVNAVDNENSGNIQDDNRRRYQTLRTLAHRHHPFSKFSTGNIETLKHGPEKKGINTREALVKFFHDYYSANRMKLVVLGKESLNDLERLVRELFSDIPNKNLPSPYIHPDPRGPAFDHKNLQKFVHVVPVKDLRRIDIYWNFPRMTASSKLREASSYLTALLGDKGKGSILSYLRHQSWGNGLEAGISINYDFSLFKVAIYCTDDGINNHVNDIISVVYNYINMLHKTFETPERCSYFFEEKKLMSCIYYWFLSERSPRRYVRSLARSLHEDIPKNDLLTNGYLRLQQCFDEVKQLLCEMKPENMICMITSKNNEAIADKEEFYYKVKYRVIDIPATFVTELHEAHDYDDLGLIITPSNKYIPFQFDLYPFEKPKLPMLHENSTRFLKAQASSTTILHRALQHTTLTDKIKVVNDTVERSLLGLWEDDTFRRPVVIHSEQTCILWLKQDTTYLGPKTNVNIFINRHIEEESFSAQCAVELFLLLIHDTYTETSNLATKAGLGHGFRRRDNGIQFNFVGFSETIPLFIEFVLSNFMTPNPNISRSSFERIKEKYLKRILNMQKSRPLILASHAIKEGLNENWQPFQAKFTALKDLTLKKVLELAPTIFQNIGIEVLVVGNARPKDALKIFEIVKKVFAPSGDVSNLRCLRTVNLSKANNPQQKYFLVPASNPKNPASAVCVLFQFGTCTVEKKGLLGLFSNKIAETFFNDLRTKQALGYRVSTEWSYGNGVVSFQFLVESNSTDPVTLCHRIEKFIDDLEDNFDEIFAEDIFKSLINARINTLLRRKKNLSQETSAWWFDITEGLYKFDENFKVSQSISQATTSSLKKLLEEYLFNGAPYRAKFVSGMLGEEHGKTIFGEGYDDMKPIENDAEHLGFNESFILKWLQRDRDMFETYVKSRGEIEVVGNIIEFKSRANFYPPEVDIVLV